MGRPPCCNKSNVKRGPWTPEEDAKILAYVASHGIGNWTLVPKKAGLNRCGKSCRLRWTNYLRPDLKHDNFTPEEEECILKMHETVGSRWSLIARQLPGRTDNDVKNHWNTKLKKKLAKMGIDPITHKPFSQVFTEYGKISCFSSTININPFPRNNSTLNESIYIPKIENPAEIATQFQVINNQEIVHNHQPYISNEASSSDTFLCSNNGAVTRFGCGPCDSCEPSSRVQIVPHSPFSCNEYILGDQLLPDQCKHLEMMKLNNEIMPACDENSSAVASSTASSAAADSFVEAILAHDSEMRLQFPNILDEDYGY